MVRAERARSEVGGPHRIGVPPGRDWQCSKATVGSSWRRVAAARLTNPGSGGRPDAAASIPPAGSASTTSRWRWPGHTMARPAVRVVTPHERTEAMATTLIDPSSAARSGREFHERDLSRRRERSHLVSVGRIDLQGHDGIRARLGRRRIDREHYRDYRDALPRNRSRTRGRAAHHRNDVHPTARSERRGIRTRLERHRHYVAAPTRWGAQVRRGEQRPRHQVDSGRSADGARLAHGQYGIKAGGRRDLHDPKVARLHHAPCGNRPSQGEHILAVRHARTDATPNVKAHPTTNSTPATIQGTCRRRCTAEGAAGPWRRALSAPFPFVEVVSVMTGIGTSPSLYAPGVVFTAWDSATRTGTCAAGPGTWPRFPPPGAPVAVQATCQ